MNIKLLKHQGLYLQAPERFPEKRHIFLTCGYAAGKTMSNVLLALYWIKKLQGKKDVAGGYARLIVAGTTLTHLEGTFLIYFRQFLNVSKSKYTEDKKHNMFIIGTVTVMLVPLENPERLYGRDVFSCICEEVDELTEDKMLEATKALSERCRQNIVGERDPFLVYASTAQGTKGLYRIYTQFKKSGIGFIFIRGRTEDNIHLSQSYINDLKRIYTPEEKRVFMDGEFIAIAKGRVFGDFDWNRNFVEYDLDTELFPGETVFIGMDFNCHAEHTRVATLRGEIPIKDVVVGDMVLTRKGYKKVLSVFANGENIVSRVAGVSSTRGHIFRTPEGDKAQWELKNYYYLPRRKRSLFRHAAIVNTMLQESDLEERCIEGTTVQIGLPESILFVTALKNFCIGLFMNGMLGKFLMVLWYIILTGLMITGQRILKRCREKNIWPSMKRVSEFQRRGRMGTLRQSACARYVESPLLEKLRQLVHVRISAVLNYESLNVESVVWERAVKVVKRCGKHAQGLYGALRRIALRATLFFRERASLNFAKNVPMSEKEYPNKSMQIEFPANVYDLEIEDAHEYFVNGTLTHNTGFNRASAYVIRKNEADEWSLFCIKAYDFPNPQDAPMVFRNDFPDQEILWLPDVTIKDSFPQFGRALRRNNIHIIYRKKSPLVEDTVFLVNKLFYTRRLIICRIAKDVAEACALFMRDVDNKVPKGKGPGSHAHFADSVRYIASFVASNRREFLDMRRLVLNKRASFRETSEELVAQLKSGYVDIDPDVYK